MWTTSSFLAKVRQRGRLLFLVSVCFAATAASQARYLADTQVPPDAPRPAPVQPKQPRVTTNFEVKKSVELRSVTVGRLTKRMEELAGEAFLKSAKDPIYIQVTTVRGVLGKPALASAPIILLNGERLLTTRSAGPNSLVAFLPDREKIKDLNSVAVAWIGKQEPTLSKKPLRFRRADIRD